MAAPCHQPNDETRTMVYAMSSVGVPVKVIANAIGLADKTVHKYYQSELDKGHAEANAAVAKSLFRQATGEGKGAVTAAIFWMKTQCGWKETSVQELTGKDGAPLPAGQSAVTIYLPDNGRDVTVAGGGGDGDGDEGDE